MKKPPNVLILTADALRADRMSLYGYDRPTTPCLERFADKAMVCDNAFTLGPFTQIACIQLFTSSRPFSYGGYDQGAQGRPETLFKRFRNAGYHTWGLSTIHWVSPYYGYTEGLDTEHSVFHLNTLVGMAVVNMRDTLRVYRLGKIPADEMLSRAVPVIEKLFSNIDNYSDKLKQRMRSYAKDFPASKIANDGYDFDKVQRVVETHRQDFHKDPLEYIHRYLSHTPKAHEWMARDWYFSRTAGKIIREGAFRLSNRFLKLANRPLADKRASSIRLSVDAHAIADKVINHLHTRDPDKPFFIWAHFKDTHTPYVSGPGREWYRHTPDYLEALGYSRDLDPTLSFRVQHAKSEEDQATLSALYDAAVRSTDEAVGKVLSTLGDLGLDDDTVVAFGGDHGDEIGEHGDYGHPCMGYEHNARVPMLFKAAGNGGAGRIDSLVSSLDWAPTIADFAGIGPAEGWEGAPVTNNKIAARDHILLENFCRGDCLFDHRPLYMGVRTKSHKYLWKEYLDPFHKYGTPENGLYDLTTDPLEQNNLYRPDHPLVDEFNRLIADRLVQVKEISDERIIAAFGTVGEEAIKSSGNRAVPA